MLAAGWVPALERRLRPLLVLGRLLCNRGSCGSAMPQSDPADSSTLLSTVRLNPTCPPARPPACLQEETALDAVQLCDRAMASGVAMEGGLAPLYAAAMLLLCARQCEWGCRRELGLAVCGHGGKAGMCDAAAAVLGSTAALLAATFPPKTAPTASLQRRTASLTAWLCAPPLLQPARPPMCWSRRCPWPSSSACPCPR